LAKALGRMEGEERFHAIRNYVDAAAAVRSLKHPQGQFGEIIAASPVRHDSWAEFVVARAVQCLDEHRHLLIGVLERPERGISALEARLASRAAASPSLVHGDYFPENVMVADGCVCGVIDFGALTLIGDADLDLACAVLNLTGMAGVTPEDRRIALNRAEALGLTRPQHPNDRAKCCDAAVFRPCATNGSARVVAVLRNHHEPHASRMVRTHHLNRPSLSRSAPRKRKA
jgi:aminoglycoside phosphotransferase (APT) family kinase protein